MDTNTEAGANRTARRIETYWRERGFIVNARVEPAQVKDGVVYGVRTDMLKGSPVRRAL